MTARHPSHPSAACECDTCELEHSCDHTNRWEVAINPHDGTIVVLYQLLDLWVTAVHGHHPDGRPRTGQRAHPTFEAAARCWWANAELASPRWLP